MIDNNLYSERIVVANSLPENEVILLTLLISKRYILFAELLNTFFSCSDDGPAVPTERPEPTMNASDSLALVDIYKAADGDKWLIKWDLTNWHSWGGAGAVYDSVNNEYRIVQLILNQDSSPEPQGIISERVGDLPYLVYFAAGGSGYTGEIPESLFRLQHLQHVRILGTSIGGEIPGYVFQAPSLEMLELNGNGFYGEIPDEIAEWDNPDAQCWLCFNHLSGKVPEGINIAWLQLRNNEYTEYPFDYLFTDTRVIMFNNYITGVIPDSVLNDLEALKRLWMYSAGEFTNEPDWWDGYIWPFDDEEEETSFAATTRMMSAPLKTRIEILDDVKLPGR